MTGLLAGLGATSPVVAAPMAGGPTTSELVVAAAQAGSLAFLAAGYLSAESLAARLDEASAGGDLVAVNLFAPPAIPVDPAAYTAYREVLLPEAERLEVELPQRPREDDDDWLDKIAVLVEATPSVVSFTFGIPGPEVVAALRRAGSLLAQTVTSVEEARLAGEAGVDVLVVQAAGAGGHSGTLTPSRRPPPVPLPRLVAGVVDAVGLPTLAAGGVANGDDVAATLAAGAEGVGVGTLLLLADEAGTSSAHRAGLDDHTRTTTLTQAFTGRPARGLRNAFVERFESRAPLGYPALHHLTRPLRQAAAAVGDPEGVNLWAGTGFASARVAPAAQILADLAARV